MFQMWACACQSAIQDFLHQRHGFRWSIVRIRVGLAHLRIVTARRGSAGTELGYRYACQDVVIFFFHSHVTVIVPRYIADYGGSQIVFRVAARQVCSKMHRVQIGTTRIGLIILLQCHELVGLVRRNVIIQGDILGAGGAFVILDRALAGSFPIPPGAMAMSLSIFRAGIFVVGKAVRSTPIS